jgi:hypothetical protein
VELAKQLAGLPEEPAATQTLEWPPRWVAICIYPNINLLLLCYIEEQRNYSPQAQLSESINEVDVTVEMHAGSCYNRKRRAGDTGDSLTAGNAC